MCDGRPAAPARTMRSMASSADEWLRKYADGEERISPLRWVCVPATVVGLVGLFWALPVPEAFRASSPALNWGTVFLSAALVYYFMISIPLAVGALPFVVAVVATVAWLDTLAAPFWPWSALLFGGAWAAQWLAVRRQTERPAFRDLQFVMIGPLWLLAHVYRRLGIPY